ncbi:MAG: hypothetical protein AABX33_02165 [Nanoarchaeota archaeon]
MSINKKELERLSPQERIKKLKLMEEEKKKEVNEIEKLIIESMRELKTDKIAEEIAPEQKPVDISSLFESGSGQRLEGKAKEEAPSAFIRSTKGYQAVAETYHAYSELKQIAGMGINLSNEQIAAIGQIGERLNTAERYMTEGEKAASKLDASRQVLYKLKKETGMH